MLTPPASGNNPSLGGNVGSIQSLVLEPNWLSSVAHGQQADPTLVPYFAKARTRFAEFFLYSVHGLKLLYCCPKPSIFQLVIPDKLGLCQLLLSEMHCSPLAGLLGDYKVIFALQSHVWWPQLTVNIRTFIYVCVTC